MISPGGRKLLPVPSSAGGAADILVSFTLGKGIAGAGGFGVSVRDGVVRAEVVSVAESATHGWFDVLVKFFEGQQTCVRQRWQHDIFVYILVVFCTMELMAKPHLATKYCSNS